MTENRSRENKPSNDLPRVSRMCTETGRTKPSPGVEPKAEAHPRGPQADEDRPVDVEKLIPL